MQQSSKAEKYLGKTTSDSKLPLTVVKSRDIENPNFIGGNEVLPTGQEINILSQNHYFMQLQAKQQSTVGELIDSHSNLTSAGILSPEKRKKSDQMISFNCEPSNDIVFVQKTDSSESALATKASEKQQQIVYGGNTNATQQFFFNTRVQNQRKVYKPRNVNLKQIWGLRASQTSTDCVAGLEDSKAQLISNGAVTTQQSLIISPSKVLQQQIKRGERQSNMDSLRSKVMKGDRALEHTSSMKLKQQTDASNEFSSILQGNMVAT